MIHSRSYTYIIKNVYSDPSEVFDTILDNEKILERAKSVTEAYNDFINAAHQYDTSNWWKPEWQSASYNAQYEKKELKRKLYRALLMSTSWRVFVFMYLLLALLLSVNSNSWKDPAKIISLIARDENQHLVLTQQHSKQLEKG